MDDLTSFGQWLRRRRRALDLTQEELAARVFCSVVTIRKIEADERRPSKEMAGRLAEQLQLASTERMAFIKSARAELGVHRLASAAARMVAVGAQDIGQDRGLPALPVPPTPLLGRAADVAAVCHALTQREVRLVTLTGPPGVGKTRLALQVAIDVGAMFPDGVHIAALAALTDAALVPSALAQALGVTDMGHQSWREGIVAALRDRHLLLIVDNFEHLLAAAPFIADVLAGVAGLRVLVTSREALRLSGEHEFLVLPLPVPGAQSAWATADLPGLAQNPAVALFVQRARAVMPAFALTVTNAASIVAICARLDGLPLALELAAARTKLFTPQALLGRLNDRFALLTGGPRDLPLRQQTLWRAIDWSYALLTLAEQRMLQWLAVFAGGCTLAAVEAAWAVAAEAVAQEPPLLLLASLLDKHLVQQSPDADGEPRFSLLETIREYGLAQLAARGREVPACDWHAAYYLALAERATRQLRGAQQEAALAQLVSEHDNLRAALDWALCTGGSATALRLTGALALFWHTRGFWAEGRGWAERALALDGGGSTGPRARGLLCVGILAWAQSDFAPAREHLVASERLASEAGDQQTWAEATGFLGLVALYTDDLTEAAPLFDASLASYRQLDDPFGVGLSLVRLGLVAAAQQQWAIAADRYAESLTAFRLISNPWGLGIAFSCLAEMARAQGDWAGALGHYEECLRLLRELGSNWYSASALVGLASVIAAQAEESAVGGLGLAQAVALLGLAGALLEAVNGRWQPPERADVDRLLATARAALGEEGFSRAWTQGRALPLSRYAELLSRDQIA